MKILRIREKLQSIKSFYILLALGAAVGIISGIGSTCTTFNFLGNWWAMPNTKGGFTFAVVGDQQPLFIISYVITWLVGILWIILYWALKSGKSWFYNVSIANCILGIVSGFIPSAILFYEWWDTFGVNGMFFTPSWARTIGNIIILIALLLPRIKSNISKELERRSSAVGGSVGTQVSNFSYVFLSFGILLAIQPIFMPMTHPIDASVYTFTGNWLETFQYVVGLLSIVIGVLLHFVGRILHLVYSPKPAPTKI